ncbi:DUF4150 domain-containing protein [Rhizobium mongolense]|uniref:DUF4150 domain-containing protein n=1 Tax=Rhizobium mongolense TaxID=57676 RepID=A0A7W6WF79_9HYPH|nr:DUF4150 domain-containing protein [Rhizobium mongolense]MBB4275378.1 hypothetical protein [Rhizobium mongolense]
MTVYANGLEIACKAQSNKVIAAFPDVCFTPPENPATPPGVPVPYPSFGFDSDTDNGTGTVKIGDQTITQKNKSYYTRTSGTEAGCAAKKGIITSANTGKEYARAWSGNVKADGEPVSRFSDLSTNNHSSPGSNTGPYPKIGKMVLTPDNCAKLLQKFGLSTTPHDKNDCPKDTMESEHFMENQFMQKESMRGGVAGTVARFKNYDEGSAPCICMVARKRKKGVDKANWPKVGTPHHGKTAQVRNFLASRRTVPTIDEALKECCKAVADNHGPTKGLSSGTKAQKEKAEQIMKCLELIFIRHLTAKINETRRSDNKITQAEVRALKIR